MAGTNTLEPATTARILYARELLSQLKSKLWLGMTVSRRFSPAGARPFGTIRVPNVVVPAAVIRPKNGALTWGDTSLSYVDVTLDSHIIVPMVLDTLDAVISDIDFRVQMASRAAYNIAAKIEGLLAGLYIKVGQFVGAVGSAAFSDLAKAQAAVKMLDDAFAPDTPRFGALSAAAKSSALGNTSFTTWTVAGPDSTLVKGTLAERLGIQWGMTQSIQGNWGVDGTTAWGTPLVSATGAIGATEVAVDGLAASGALKAGDAFILKNYYYSVTEDVTASTGAATIKISPPLKTAVADGDAITIGEGVKRTGYNNLVYVPEAFALAVAPMDDTRPGTDSNLITDEQTGLGIRVTYSFDHTNMRHLFTTELLAGVQCVRPELAVRLIASG